ncbi:MAG TPA: cytochrome c oxidase subunit 3 family protein [Polyangiaceae bacterium]|jgi:cytochrome c oxidase subunit 3|nr:cytochrome c oxidase subunit 3 family protein [Polyangiaceae bacterium]
MTETTLASGGAASSVDAAEHFEDMTRQAHAARLGMWVFLASEVLFFAGLFALYATYRVEHPDGFGEGVLHNTLVWGSINTGVLLVSSYCIALAVHALRRGQIKTAVRLTGLTIACGFAFLGIKTHEYLEHFREGIYPGGVGDFFHAHKEPGIEMFFTLYFCMTGLHAIHVIVGMGVLAFLLSKLVRGQITPMASHPLAIGAVYWHLVDAIWIFLWPLFYLVPGTAK